MQIGAHEHPLDWLTSSRLTHVPDMHQWHLFCAGDRTAALMPQRRSFKASCPMTEIGNDVWIGQSVYVKAGVLIGDGAIIGARSVVTKDVAPYTIVVGQPAKPVRLRFPEPLVERLLGSAWWRYSLYDLYDIPFEDVPRALDLIGERVANGTVQPYEPQRLTPSDLADIAAALKPGAMKAAE